MACKEESKRTVSSGFKAKRTQSENGLRRLSRSTQRQRRYYSQMDLRKFLAALEDGEQEAFFMMGKVKEYVTTVRQTQTARCKQEQNKRKWIIRKWNRDNVIRLKGAREGGG